MNQHLHVNKTNFHMKGFALGLALKQRRKATRKSPIVEGETTAPFYFLVLPVWRICYYYLYFIYVNMF